MVAGLERLVPAYKACLLGVQALCKALTAAGLGPPRCPAVQTAALELLGAGASYGYLLLLFRDVDALAPGDRIYMQEAEAVEPKFARGLAKWAASYRCACWGAAG